MYIKNGIQIDGYTWITYSGDGSNKPETMVQTQPVNATSAQLTRMGVTAQADPPPPLPPPPPIPELISNRQFYQQLSVQGLCTQSEALSAVQIGSLPSALATLVNNLPAAQQFGAKIMLSGATQFLRHHPLTATLAQAYGWTDAQTDALWTAAAQL